MKIKELPPAQMALVALIASAITALILTSLFWLNQRVAVTTEEDQLSYTIGHQVGQNLKREGLKLDSKVIGRAIDDVLRDSPLLLSEQQMAEVMQKLQLEVQKKMAAEGEKNRLASEEFLKNNQTRAGVKVLKNGLQYEVLTAGKGKLPKADSQITVRYTGQLISGEIFDATETRGPQADLNMKHVFPGLRQSLMLMPEGSVYKLYIPPHLAYGESPRPGIPVQSVLIYKIELLKVK